MGKTFSTGLLTDGISQDSSNNIGIGVAPSGTNKFEVSGSTKLNGNALMSGSLTISSSANAIILPAGQTIGLGTAQIYTGTGGNSGNIFIQGAQTKLYADKVVLEAATAAGVEVIGGTKLSGSLIVSGSATTIGATTLSGSLNVSGSITSTSTITAQTLVVQTITSSVLYSSGSNVFGNSLSNTQVMTGSVGITGSLTLNNIAIPTSASLASTYLPLTGGTLTGALGGTTAAFSTSVTINGAATSGKLNIQTANDNGLYIYNGSSASRFMLNNYFGFGIDALFLQEWNTSNVFQRNVMTFYTGGNVGVGTGGTDAGYKLDVNGTGRFSGAINASGGRVNILGSNQNSILLNENAGGSSTGFLIGRSYSTDNAQNFFIYDIAAAAPRLFINSSGNVGIGTTSPTTKLTIDNSASSNTNHIDLVGPISSGGKGHVGYFAGGLYLTSNYYYNGGQNNDTGSLGQGSIVIGSSPTVGASSISFALSDPGATSPSTKVNILSNGNVGIGTASPSIKLQVVESGANWVADFKNYGSGAYGVRIDLSGSTGTAGAYAFRIYTQTNDGFYLLNNGAFYAQGVYNYTSSSGTAVYVDSGGNLYRFTSSLRYKRDIVSYTNGLTELLKIEPKFYKSKNPKEGEKVFAGLIAEQIDEIGLNEFVEYNDEGQPDAVHYSAMTALLVKSIQELKAENDALKDTLQRNNII
jgi:hypothetical protein